MKFATASSIQPGVVPTIKSAIGNESTIKLVPGTHYAHLLGGLPGTGKTTIARELARQLGAVHVRIDSIEEAILDSGGTQFPNGSKSETVHRYLPLKSRSSVDTKEHQHRVETRISDIARLRSPTTWQDACAQTFET